MRAIEDMVREHAEGGGVGPDARVEPAARLRVAANGTRPTVPAGPRRLPPPGILELEELLSGHLNTRVKVDLTSKRGKVVVEFATLEDLERIYKLMVGRAQPDRRLTVTH